jgi:hypothetical protein
MTHDDRKGEKDMARYSMACHEEPVHQAINYSVETPPLEFIRLYTKYIQHSIIISYIIV